MPHGKNMPSSFWPLRTFCEPVSASGAVPGRSVQLVPEGPNADAEQLRGAGPIPSADLERAVDQSRLRFSNVQGGEQEGVWWQGAEVL